MSTNLPAKDLLALADTAIRLGRVARNLRNMHDNDGRGTSEIQRENAANKAAHDAEKAYRAARAASPVTLEEHLLADEHIKDDLSGQRPMPDTGNCSGTPDSLTLPLPGEAVIGRFASGEIHVDAPIVMRPAWFHAELGHPVADPVSWHRKGGSDVPCAPRR